MRGDGGSVMTVSLSRPEARQDTRAGSYDRTLQTSAGEVNLKVPKLRRQTFETAIIGRYRRRESSVEEALIEMYLAGISVRRVEDITEALWGTRVSPSMVSNLNKKIYAKIEAWRNWRIEGEHPYLYLDGIVMKRTWAGEVRNVSLLMASAVNSEGFREILGICEGAKEDKSGWSAFLRHLVERGLKGVQLIISDACRGLTESAAALHGAFLQECIQPRSSDQSPRGEPYAQGYPCPGEPGRGRPQGTSDRRRPAHREDEHGGRSRRAERVRNERGAGMNTKTHFLFREVPLRDETPKYPLRDRTLESHVPRQFPHTETRSLCTKRAISRHFEHDPIPYALETDWLAGAARFEPLHFGIEIRSCASSPELTFFGIRVRHDTFNQDAHARILTPRAESLRELRF